MPVPWQTSLVNRLLTYQNSLAGAFRSMDRNRLGMLDRQAVREFFAESSGYQRHTKNPGAGRNLGGVSGNAIEVAYLPSGGGVFDFPLSNPCSHHEGFFLHFFRVFPHQWGHNCNYFLLAHSTQGSDCNHLVCTRSAC